MSRTSPLTVILTRQERAELEGRTRAYSLPYRDVVRARMILLAADGVPVEEIALRTDTRREVVWKWRRRFLEQGVPGLEERPRRGRPAVFSPGGRG